MKKMAAKKQHWLSFGHGQNRDIPSESEFFSVAKASELVVCHFYRENSSCKVFNYSPTSKLKNHVMIVYAPKGLTDLHF
jgi:hypothetical protein